jgi:hypothetical protein
MIKISIMIASVLAIASNAAAEDKPARPGTEERKIDPKADRLLRKMSSDLADVKNATFDTENVTEVVTKDGQKLQVLASSSVALERPGKLRSDRKGPRGDVTFLYDGKNITVYGKRDNLYATAKAPEQLDQAIDFAREELGLEAPAADLLYTDSYSILMEDVVSGQYIDQAQIGNRTCHHLAYRGHETDWEIWIEDGPRALPCRFVITSKNVAGSPQYTAEISNWQVDKSLPEREFTFTPPRDATKIDFMNVAKRQHEPTKQGGPS